MHRGEVMGPVTSPSSICKAWDCTVHVGNSALAAATDETILNAGRDRGAIVVTLEGGFEELPQCFWVLASAACNDATSASSAATRAASSAP